MPYVVQGLLTGLVPQAAQLSGRMSMKIIVGALLSALPVLAFVSADARAEPRMSPLDRVCTEFDSPRDFVRQASLYCLNHGRSNECTERAHRFFAQCGFGGDFAELH